MLLNNDKTMHAKSGLGLAICWILLVVVLPGTGCAGTPAAECSIYLPVYDPHGNHLPFRITAAKVDIKDGIDLLTTSDPKRRVRADGETLYFPKTLHTPLRVTLEGPQGAITYGSIGLTGCKLTNSLRYGQLDSGLDVAWSTIGGKLSGCRFTGDWWIRAAPMFGDAQTSLAFEGNVEPDGTFTIDGGMPGVRHIVVVGKGKEPVKAFAVDVTVGGKMHEPMSRINNAGNIDLSGSCPK
jgi:hypothetical protein